MPRRPYTSLTMEEILYMIRHIMYSRQLVYERKVKKSLGFLEDILTNNGSEAVKRMKIDRDIRSTTKIIMCHREEWVKIFNSQYAFDTLTLNEFMKHLLTIKREFVNPSILEVDAELGFLSFFIKYYNIDIQTTDVGLWMIDRKIPYLPIVKMDRTIAIAEFKPDILIAPFVQNETFNFDYYHGKYLIVIGIIPTNYENSWSYHTQVEFPHFVNSVPQYATFLVRKN